MGGRGSSSSSFGSTEQRAHSEALGVLRSNGLSRYDKIAHGTYSAASKHRYESIASGASAGRISGKTKAEVSALNEETYLRAVRRYAGAELGSKAEYGSYKSAIKTHDRVKAALGESTSSKATSTSKAASRTLPTVNGYGERTSRYITSGTYERAMKRQEKAVLRNMGY